MLAELPPKKKVNSGNPQNAKHVISRAIFTEFLNNFHILQKQPSIKWSIL